MGLRFVFVLPSCSDTSLALLFTFHVDEIKRPTGQILRLLNILLFLPFLPFNWSGCLCTLLFFTSLRFYSFFEGRLTPPPTHNIFRNYFNRAATLSSIAEQSESQGHSAQFGTHLFRPDVRRPVPLKKKKIGKV